MGDRPQGVLSPYRVLDLAGEQGLFCGKVLGDYGADVIKIEPLTRRPGPSYRSFLSRRAGPREEPVLVCLQHQQTRDHP